MNTSNYISDKWSCFWYLHPISHLNANGHVKPLEAYRKEIKQSLPKIYEEHERLLEFSEKGKVSGFFYTAGLMVAGKYSFTSLVTDKLSTFISPISHYNVNGYLKTHEQFRSDLKIELGNIYRYHKELEIYENSSYTELSFNKMGVCVESSAACIGNILTCNLPRLVVNSTSAIGNGVAATTFGIVAVSNGVVNVASTGYNLISNLLSFSWNMISYLSNKAFADEKASKPLAVEVITPYEGLNENHGHELIQVDTLPIYTV